MARVGVDLLLRQGLEAAGAGGQAIALTFLDKLVVAGGWALWDQACDIVCTCIRATGVLESQVRARVGGARSSRTRPLAAAARKPDADLGADFPVAILPLRGRSLRCALTSRPRPIPPSRRTQLLQYAQLHASAAAVDSSALDDARVRAAQETPLHACVEAVVRGMFGARREREERAWREGRVVADSGGDGSASGPATAGASIGSAPLPLSALTLSDVAASLLIELAQLVATGVGVTTRATAAKWIGRVLEEGRGLGVPASGERVVRVSRWRSRRRSRRLAGSCLVSRARWPLRSRAAVSAPGAGRLLRTAARGRGRRGVANSAALRRALPRVRRRGRAGAVLVSALRARVPAARRHRGPSLSAVESGTYSLDSPASPLPCSQRRQRHYARQRRAAAAPRRGGGGRAGHAGRGRSRHGRRPLRDGASPHVCAHPFRGA